MIGGAVAIVPALIVPVVILVGLLLQPILRRLSGDTMVQGQNKQSLMVEIIAAIKTLKTVRGFGSLYERWMQSVALQDNYSHRMKYFRPVGSKHRCRPVSNSIKSALLCMVSI